MRSNTHSHPPHPRFTRRRAPKGNRCCCPSEERRVGQRRRASLPCHVYRCPSASRASRDGTAPACLPSTPPHRAHLLTRCSGCSSHTSLPTKPAAPPPRSPASVHHLAPWLAHNTGHHQPSTSVAQEALRQAPRGGYSSQPPHRTHTAASRQQR